MHPTKLSSTGLINIIRLFVTILLFKVLLIIWHNCFIIVYIDYCLLFVKSDLILDDRLIQEIIIYCGLEHKSNAQETPTVKLFFLTYLVLIEQTLLLVCSLAHQFISVMFLVMFMSLQLAKFIDILKVPIQKALFYIYILLFHSNCYMDANLLDYGLLQYHQILFLLSLA